MRKALGYLSIFVLGCAVTLVMLRTYSGFNRATDLQAKRNVLSILDRAPSGPIVPENAIVAAAAKIEPAVVNIDTVGQRRASALSPFGIPIERNYTMQGKGSGVLISPDGYVVTNNHVVEGATIIRVTMVNGRRFDGRVIGADPLADLAVVKIDGRNLPNADLGDPFWLKVGEYVIAIGYPLGIGTTVTHGIISAVDRKNLALGEGRTLSQALQTDAPINRGNSGGALANMNGQLIGINTAIASENGGGNIGIGFAIPINGARTILKSLIEKGRTLPPEGNEPFIGVAAEPLQPDAAAQLRIPAGQGVVIVQVYPLTPAANAGLETGDVVVSIDGATVSNQDDVRNAIRRKQVGQQVVVRRVRGDGTPSEVRVTVGRRPSGLGK